ncbi:hypothetical protein BC835DRAFT_1215185, partial [Cytidiella melzeri]
SHDLKARIPVLFYEQGYTVKKIGHILGVSKLLVYNSLNSYGCFGVAHNPFARQCGHRRLMTQEDINYLRSLLSHRHSYYLDELQLKLLEHRGLDISIATVCRTLRRLRISRKRVWKKAAERNDLLRAAYWNRFATLVPDPNMLIVTDESHKNQRTHDRLYGYSEIEIPCVQR